jgi:hypothetical protein
MTARPTDHAWEALVEVTNASVAQERGMLNYALGQIRAATAELELSGEELALVIRHQASRYRETWPDLALTPNALAKHWDRIRVEYERMMERRAEAEAEAAEAAKRRVRGTNLRIESHCVTCKGNSWVVVSYRKPRASAWMLEHGIKVPDHPSDPGLEETAPCPVCNDDSRTMGGYWRNRTWGYSSVPGEVVIT